MLGKLLPEAMVEAEAEEGAEEEEVEEEEVGGGEGRAGGGGCTSDSAAVVGCGAWNSEERTAAIQPLPRRDAARAQPTAHSTSTSAYASNLKQCMQHPSRKRDEQSEASAARVLQWARATRQRVVAQQPAGGGRGGGDGGGGAAAAAAPTPLGAHDDDMRQTLQQMLKETPLEDITPHMLKARQEHPCRAGRGEGAGTKVPAYWYKSTCLLVQQYKC